MVSISIELTYKDEHMEDWKFIILR